MTVLYIIAIVFVIIFASFVLAMIMSCCIVSGQCSKDEDDFSDMNMDLNGCIIAVDFDNTIAVTEYPKIIKPIHTTIEVLKRTKELGATIILWTCREDKELEEAVAWCKENNVPIDYVNENVPERIEKWGNDCRKIGADIYIDDKAMNPSIWLNKGVIK